jgi:hypothetical protein
MTEFTGSAPATEGLTPTFSDSAGERRVRFHSPPSIRTEIFYGFVYGGYSKLG